MEMYGLYVKEVASQVYDIYIPGCQVQCVARIYLGNDRAYIMDSRILEIICKALAKKWLPNNKKN